MASLILRLLYLKRMSHRCPFYRRQSGPPHETAEVEIIFTGGGGVRGVQTGRSLLETGTSGGLL
jgi:hypothetical protein